VIIQALLIGALLGLFVYAVSQRRRSAFLAVIMMAGSVLGSVLVLFPELTNRTAHAVGVGRGADLVLYCFVLVTLVAIFNIHLRLRSYSETTTELARSLALISAGRPEDGETDQAGRDRPGRPALPPSPR
jgi:hypothetical protein